MIWYQQLVVIFINLYLIEYTIQGFMFNKQINYFRGVMDESGEQFVAYFLPSEETIVKRREDIVENRSYDDDYEYEYKMAREYNWNVKSKSSKGYEENYFLIVRQDGVFYNELETRFDLNYLLYFQ